MDDTDRQIINMLRRNGRRSNVEIARELGLSEGTVRKRVDRLLETEALKIVGVVEPAKLGFGTRTLVFVTTDLPQLQSAGAALCAMPEVMSVYYVTGEFDLVIEAVFESDAHLLSFLNDKLAKVAGVRASKVGHVPQILKQRHEWALPEPPPPTVLVVDDDPDFVEFARLVLEQEGYTVRTANSGRAGLGDIAQVVPDLVILDIMMEGVLDGWDASRRVRQDPRWRGIPILVVSSITSSEYLAQIPTDDDNLIDNFLSKPVDPNVLKSEVQRLMGRRPSWAPGRLR